MDFFSQLTEGEQLIWVMSGLMGLFIIYQIFKGLMGILKEDFDFHYESRYVQFSLYVYGPKAIFVGIVVIVHGMIFAVLLLLNLFARLPGVEIANAYLHYDYYYELYMMFVYFALFILYGITWLILVYFIESLADRSTNY